MKVKSLSHVQLFSTPWIGAFQAPPSMKFSRQGYWSGLLSPSLGIFLSQGLNLGFPHCRQTLYHLSHQGSPNPTNIRLNQLKLLIFDYFWPIHRAISYGSIWYIFTMWLGIQVYFLCAPCVAILWSLNMWQFFGEKNNQIKMIVGLMMSHLLISSMISAD